MQPPGSFVPPSERRLTAGPVPPSSRPDEVLERNRTLLITAGAMLVAIFFGVLLPLLGYRFDQAPHRLFKILAVAVVVALFLTRPRWLPAFLCLALPFADWLPKSPIPLLNAANLLVVGSLAGVFLLTIKGEAHPIMRSSLNKPVFIFLVWMLLSWAYGAFLWGDRSAGGFERLKYLWGVVSGFLVFFAVTHLVKDRAAVWRTIGMLILGSTLGLLGPVRETIKEGLGTRTLGGIGDINRMGAFVALTSVLAFCLIPAFRGWRKLGAVLAAVLSAVGLVLPNSRGAYVGFIVASFPQALRTSIGGTMLLVAFLASGVIWAPSFVKERAASTWQAAAAEDKQSALDLDSGGRITVWKDILKVIEEHPVVGVGFGNLIEATGLTSGLYKHAHNMYLEVAGEMGIIGLALLLWIWISAWRLGSILARRGGRTRTLGLAYHGVIVCLVVSNLFGQRFLDFSLAGFFFLLSGLVVLEERFTRSGGQDLAAAAPARLND
jgi:O-antigen ligase